MYAALSRNNTTPKTTNKQPLAHSGDPLASLARDFFGFDAFATPREAARAAQTHPKFDLLESAQAYTLRGDLPGVSEENLDITVHEGVLSIKGSSEEEEVSEDAKFLVRERRYGEFTRSLKLPKDANPEAVSAKLENGVLEISIAKKEELKARKIEIG